MSGEQIEYWRLFLKIDFLVFLFWMVWAYEKLLQYLGEGDD